MARNNVRTIALDKVLLGDNRRFASASPVPQIGAAKMMVIIVLLAGLVFTGLLFTWSHLQYLELSSQISQTYNDQKELHNLNRKLRIELMNLKSLARLESLATENFSMAPPESHQVVNLR
ncbi:cell division protein FtsL [Desulfobacca acetoxidans]|uniref:Septum formation initiator n=1 Tax=Desulfobacca acetoxidans (strain ATCC 700848 / DSM 11109 / ASRB2) TaxID=880072 RepID=F2NG77_DESAR|nr:cell division protein FtsL [Desulfobacca acetoxidans]AEB08490.1 Septum formation initiator [Desulfobacca acetoxidans DSM 11109]